MMIAIAMTDLDWFFYLREFTFDEVNFWTPTPWRFRKLKPGEKFYFLLKSPIRRIGGYGYFGYYDEMSARDAWEKFGKANGVPDFSILVKKINDYASRNSNRYIYSNNPLIGCIIIEKPVFFNDDEFFEPERYQKPVPSSIVKFKTFTEDFPGYAIRNHLNLRQSFHLVEDNTGVNYRISKSKDRSGQSQFRQQVLEAYGYKCCISGETCLEIIEAAHIQPYINENSNHVQNGIPLRVDLHRLFDLGLITIDTEYKVRISDQLSSSDYNCYRNRAIYLPEDPTKYPSKEALTYHNKMVFRGKLK
ncbi:putative restriction endonuclease [Thermanaeromonas toyohensis ToBE]|uniref:Putative restriction endonuclease n=1 Tax=Thermanaeromonas toyohensis ToBE TaxID=698762 RepID=A0A1W1W0B6_9FIRM|nr:HNH endonuclease [Thermanaeromonas toyohensis]SMB98811.1 putative restriction endonuclease [Thermanaeromonas toyohensis ToBE]